MDRNSRHVLLITFALYPLVATGVVRSQTALGPGVDPLPGTASSGALDENAPADLLPPPEPSLTPVTPGQPPAPSVTPQPLTVDAVGPGAEPPISDAEPGDGGDEPDNGWTFFPPEAGPPTPPGGEDSDVGEPLLPDIAAPGDTASPEQGESPPADPPTSPPPPGPPVVEPSPAMDLPTPSAPTPPVSDDDVEVPEPVDDVDPLPPGEST